MNANVLISVVLPVYNGEKYIKDAVDSILEQTYGEFELIVLNDGSSDRTPQILEQFRDSRIRLVHQPNQGLVQTLNKGMAMAQGELIARMDADDISHPSRFQRQKAFLEANPEVGVVSSFYFEIFGNRIQKPLPLPVSDAQIRSWMFIGNPLSHPAAMMRRAAVQAMDTLYREEFKHCEDFDLWERMALTTKLANIPEGLLYYRNHDSNISEVNARTTNDGRVAVIRRLLMRYGLERSAEEIEAALGIAGQPVRIGKMDAYLGSVAQALPEAIRGDALHCYNQELKKQIAKQAGLPGLWQYWNGAIRAASGTGGAPKLLANASLRTLKSIARKTLGKSHYASA